jgi:hypothetical protein
LVVTTIVSVFTVGIMYTTGFVALVGLVVGHVAGSSCVPWSTSTCWGTGIVATDSPTMAFYGAMVAS